MTLLDQEFTKLKNIRLSSETRLRIREELLSYADLHTYQPSAVSSYARGWQGFQFRLYAGLTALALFVMSAGGTAFAAENTLPGDALYSVKIHITEPIQTALVPSDQGKAAWHAILAERRLEEAVALAADQKLSPEIQVALTDNLNTQVAESVESAERIQNSGDTKMALRVRSDLEARLTAHEHILDVIADHYAQVPTVESAPTKLALDSLLETVHGHEEAIASSRLALEASIATDTIAVNDVASDDSATGPVQSKVAIAPDVSPSIVTSATEVADSETMRAQEVDDILARHATLLAKFLPMIGTSTATSTATTTVSATTTATSTIEMSDDAKEKPE